jgi:hypothetical protein
MDQHNKNNEIKTETDTKTHVVSKEVNKNIDIIKIMNRIEDETTGKVMDFRKKTFDTNEQAQNALINIMQQGADEFKEKTGRHMTYSEMRQMYG